MVIVMVTVVVTVVDHGDGQGDVAMSASHKVLSLCRN